MNVKIAIIPIIIPADNAAKTIFSTLSSVQKNRFSDWEAIVIEEGLNDGTTQIINGMNDPRINVISYPNAGVAVARNYRLMKATVVVPKPPVFYRQFSGWYLIKWMILTKFLPQFLRWNIIASTLKF